FSSRRRHTRSKRDWSSDVCSSDLAEAAREYAAWNLFTGDRDDGQHYASGRFLPTSSLAAAGSEPPVRFEPAEPVEPLGSTAFRRSEERRVGKECRGRWQRCRAEQV